VDKARRTHAKGTWPKVALEKKKKKKRRKEVGAKELVLCSIEGFYTTTCA